MIETKESNALVYVRVTGMMSIVLCHVLQAVDSPLANLFNIGVPIFLCLSGYLYGHKKVKNWKTWGVERFQKVYWPYLCLLAFTLPFYAVFHSECLSVDSIGLQVANLQGFVHTFRGGHINGLNHTWYITACFCGYAITPLLQRMKRRADILLPILLAGVLTSYLLIKNDALLFVVSWLYLYALGYLYANSKHKMLYTFLFLAVFVGAVVYAASSRDFSYPVGKVIKDFAGIGAVSWLILIIRQVADKVPTFVRHLNDYSYEAYLTNYWLLVGPFSVSVLFGDKIVGIFVAFCLIFLMSVLLKYIHERIGKLVFTKNTAVR